MYEVLYFSWKILVEYQILISKLAILFWLMYMWCFISYEKLYYQHVDSVMSAVPYKVMVAGANSPKNVICGLCRRGNSDKPDTFRPFPLIRSIHHTWFGDRVKCGHRTYLSTVFYILAKIVQLRWNKWKRKWKALVKKKISIGICYALM